MRLSWQRITAILAVTSHVLVITVANAFHQHDCCVCSEDASAQAAHLETIAPCCLHGHASACHESQTEVRLNGQRSPEDCQICQFLSQKWMPVHLPTALKLTEVVDPPPSGRPQRLPLPLPRTWQSRGPPVVA